MVVRLLRFYFAVYEDRFIKIMSQTQLTVLLSLCLAVAPLSAAAQVPSKSPRIAHDIRHDISHPLSELVSTSLQKSVAMNTTPDATPTAYSSSALLSPIGVSTLVGLSFNGVGYNGYGTAPPDANLAVGVTQVVQWVNSKFAVYDKATGKVVLGPAAVTTLFQGFGGLCSTVNQGDPNVQYDKAAGRWVFSRHAYQTGGPYIQCVAVSTTNDATGSYNRYAFQLPNFFPDYPKLGVWSDGYYLAVDELDPITFAYSRVLVCALQRSRMLAGQSATSQCFSLNTANGHSFLPSDLDGSLPPPAGSPNYFLNFSSTSSLNLWKFRVSWSVPSNSRFLGPLAIPVDPFTESCGGNVCIPQANTSQRLDSVADRLMYRLAYRNFGSHESLVVTHSVNSPAHIRWYEIRSPRPTPFVYQQGTYGDSSLHRWMGSIAMDQAGNIAVGYSVSGPNMHPAIRFAGRVPGEQLGTLEAETSIIAGTGSQTVGNRWGDYSAMAIDPVDDCTFWYTNEYLTANGSKNWSTRIASFKFSSCP